VGAKEARLSIMVGGDEESVTAVKPLFEVMGKNIVHLGPASSGASSSSHASPSCFSSRPLLSTGQHTKMVNQILIASTMVQPPLMAVVWGKRPALVLSCLPTRWEWWRVCCMGTRRDWTLTR
jgi:3-hydroxyisobutyrate dehydrogenase